MTQTVAVDTNAAIAELDRVEGWLYLAARCLAEPAHAALYVEGAEPIECVKRLHDAVGAVESCRKSVLGLQRALGKAKP